MRAWKGITFYNDTTGTSPEAVIVALSVFPKRKIVLIAGGNDKNLLYGEFVKEIRQKAKFLVLFSGTATEKIKKLLPKNFVYVEVKNMKDAFKEVLAHSTKGDTVLLSPGAASFGIFKNEYDRGDQFVRVVKNL